MNFSSNANQRPSPTMNNKLDDKQQQLARAIGYGILIATVPLAAGGTLALIVGKIFLSKRPTQTSNTAATAMTATTNNSNNSTSTSMSPVRPAPTTNSVATGTAAAAAAMSASPYRSPLIKQKPKQQELQAQAQATIFDACGNVLTTVDASLPPPNPNAPHWLDGACFGAGPACGKSTLSEVAPDAVVDAECWVSFRRAKRVFAFGRIEGSSNWENETDMTALFFRAVVPVTLASMYLGRVVLYNCINPTSIVLAGMFTSGVRDVFPRQQQQNQQEQQSSRSSPVSSLLDAHRAAILFVADPADLDARLEERAHKRTQNFIHWDNKHFNYSWHRYEHLLWRGVATEHHLPLVPARDNAPLRNLVSSCASRLHERLLEIARGGHHHVVHFTEESGGSRRDFWTLVEVLPLQWALFKGPWPGLTPRGANNSNSSNNTGALDSAASDVAREERDYPPPILNSWFVSPYTTGHDEDAVDPAQHNSDVAAALASTVTPASDVRGATYLVQSPFVAPMWGSEPTPFRAILLLSRKREVLLVRPGIEPAKPSGEPAWIKAGVAGLECEQQVITGARVPMLQRSPAGYASSFIPTWHLSKKPHSGGGERQEQQEQQGQGHEQQPQQPLFACEPITVKCSLSRNVTPAASPERFAAATASSTTYATPPRVAAAATTTAEKPKQTAVIVYFGSFAPFHTGHKETLVLARETLLEQNFDVLGAYVVPVAHLYPKDAPLKGLAPWAIRAAITQACIADLGWAAVDFSQGFPNVCVESIAQRIAAAYFAGGGAAEAAAQGILSPLTSASASNNDGGAAHSSAMSSSLPQVFWINGTDIELSNYMQWLMAETDLVSLLFMPRAVSSSSSSLSSSSASPDTQRQQQKAADDEVARKRAEATQFGGRMLVSDKQPQLCLSSTQVRKQVLSGNFAEAARMVGNEMAASFMLWAVHEVDEHGRQLGFEAVAKKRAGAEE